MDITHINPAALHNNPAFSHATVVGADAKIIYVGGQNAVDRSGQVIGDTLGVQTEKAFQNLLEVLKEVGASQKDVLKLNIYIQAGHDIREGFAASYKVWGQHPTALTVLQVAGFANPDFLVEIEAVAAIKDQE